MPVDHKRNPRPETSQPYHQLYDTDEDEQTPPPDGANRPDGRSHDQLRPIYVRLGTTLHAQGSAYLELGGTKVAAAVYGPREVPRRADFSTSGQLGCELKLAPFACRRRRGYIPDNEERELSQCLRTAVEPAVCLHEFPKSHVDVWVSVLEDGGGALAAAVTAAAAALADAGVPMYDLVTAAALRHVDGTNLLDPDSAELDRLTQATGGVTEYGDVTLGYMPKLQQVTCLYSEGVLSPLAVSGAVSTLTDACRQVYGLVRHRLLEKARRPHRAGTRDRPQR